MVMYPEYFGSSYTLKRIKAGKTRAEYYFNFFLTTVLHGVSMELHWVSYKHYSVKLSAKLHETPWFISFQN